MYSLINIYLHVQIGGKSIPGTEWEPVGQILWDIKCKFFQQESTFHPLPTPAILFADLKCVDQSGVYTDDNSEISNSFTWNRCLSHDGIDISQGIDSAEWMPWVHKSLKIRTLLLQKYCCQMRLYSKEKHGYGTLYAGVEYKSPYIVVNSVISYPLQRERGGLGKIFPIG